MSGLAGALRYRRKSEIYTAFANSNGDYMATFTRMMKWKEVDGTLNLSADLQAHHDPQHGFATACSVGYGLRFMKSMSQIHGKVDSNFTISTSIEEAITNVAKLTLTAELDLRKSDYKVGMCFFFQE